MHKELQNSIFLTGFMGAGKTTVGMQLARLIGCEFSDLDDVVGKREGRSIPEIFDEDGEEYFRDCESSALETLPLNQSLVIATGGGLVIREENRLMMRETGCIVYLRASWEVLKERLQSSVDRPLVDPEKGWASVRELWMQRQVYYEDADFVIDTDGLEPSEVALEIYKLVSVNHQ